MKSILLFFILLFNTHALELPADLQLQTLDGKSEEPKASRQLVYFWATWCKSCLPKLQETLPQLNKEGIPVVTVNMDERPKRAIKYQSKKDISLPVFRDTAGIFEKKLNINTLPHWAVIEKSKVTGKWQLISHQTGFNKNKIVELFNQNSKENK